MMAGPQDGGAARPSCCGRCLCCSAAQPVCDAHWVALTEKALTMTLLCLGSAGQVHLPCEQGRYVGGYGVMQLVG